MKVVFRTDASLQIGSGHAMRCVTLANALRERGSECRFVCRAHPGNLFELIRRHGHDLAVLPLVSPDSSALANGMLPVHAPWLGSDWQVDAARTLHEVESLGADWLVVDHYSLDTRWEEAVRGACRNLMAIDDLADRPHDCDLLLDQTHGRSADDYRGLLPAHCRVLVGAEFALLRPEFSALRNYSLRRRQSSECRKLLVGMGGVDQEDATSRVLSALDGAAMPAGCRITVVMGAAAPHLPAVRAQAAGLRWRTEVRVDVTNMAQLMADADLAIGAAGGSAWERCCLGLPTIALVLADNQRKVAASLAGAGAAVVVPDDDALTTRLAHETARLAANPVALSEMALAASKLTDGSGTDTVIAELEVRCG